MNSPRVTICVPNLNTLPYLPERMATIQAQTFIDWELLVYDSYSTDGAWEYFTEYAAKESRMTCWQGPREGTPGSWTPCIQKARGEYVYIATSDDTMAEDCLEKMVKALDENRDCDLAHCSIRIIDENGEPGFDWWSEHSLFAKSSGNLFLQPHKRIAPFDGVLCLLGDNIYTSVTQLLIRRTLFDKIGFFQKDFGAAGDFHWNLRAGLAASTVHVPDTWGGWRIHPNQATVAADLSSPEHAAKIDAMIDDVLANLEKFTTTQTDGQAMQDLVKRAQDLKTYLRDQVRQETLADRGAFMIREALSGRRSVWEHIGAKVSKAKTWPKVAPESVKSWFKQDVLVPLLPPAEV